MPDLAFLCPKPCGHLLSRYIAEGAEVRATCQFCGNVIDEALFTRNDGQVVEVSGVFHRDGAPARSGGPLRLPGDQYDYISPIDGTHIASKRAHRDHLKRHGVIELGNEKPNLSKPFTPQIPREAIRAEMKNNLERMKSDGSWRER